MDRVARHALAPFPQLTTPAREDHFYFLTEGASASISSRTLWSAP